MYLGFWKNTLCSDGKRSSIYSRVSALQTVALLTTNPFHQQTISQHVEILVKTSPSPIYSCSSPSPKFTPVYHGKRPSRGALQKHTLIMLESAHICSLSMIRVGVLQEKGVSLTKFQIHWPVDLQNINIFCRCHLRNSCTRLLSSRWTSFIMTMERQLQIHLYHYQLLISAVSQYLCFEALKKTCRIPLTKVTTSQAGTLLKSDSLQQCFQGISQPVTLTISLGLKLFISDDLFAT